MTRRLAGIACKANYAANVKVNMPDACLVVISEVLKDTNIVCIVIEAWNKKGLTK